MLAERYNYISSMTYGRLYIYTWVDSALYRALCMEPWKLGATLAPPRLKLDTLPPPPACLEPLCEAPPWLAPPAMLGGAGRTGTPANA